MVRRIIIALMLRIMRFYQIGISPMLRPSCRVTPTCSQYAIEVIRKDGPIVGSWRTVRRIAKCHPFHPGGYDPP